MLGIGTALVSMGIGFVKDLIMDNGEDLVKEGIKKVTGIDLNKKKVSDLTKEDIAKINSFKLDIQKLDYAKLELSYKDRSSARKREVDIQAAKDWLVRNTGSMLAIFTVLSAFAMDVMLLNMITDDSVTINPMFTLIQGAMNVRAVQVLSFYFGDSKAQADSKRGV